MLLQALQRALLYGPSLGDVSAVFSICFVTISVIEIDGEPAGSIHSSFFPPFCTEGTVSRASASANARQVTPQGVTTNIKTNAVFFRFLP